MIRTQLKRTWHFHAAHQLLHHNGPCARPHGHTYHVTVEVSGEIQPVDGRPDGGMVVDFSFLDATWRSVEHRLDHRDLNVTLAGEPPNDFIDATSSELIAQYLFEYFTASVRQQLPDRDDLTVLSITVSESPTSSATHPAP